MKNIIINIIAGDAQTDNMMHACDLFEPFKRIGEILSIEYELQVSLPNLDFLNRLKSQFEGNGYIVTALWFAHDPKINYIDWTVKVFSDGKKFILLEPYLKQFGIHPPT